jgi:hypothetical protein
MTRVIQINDKMGNMSSMEEDFNAWQSVVLVEEDMAHLMRIEYLEMDSVHLSSNQYVTSLCICTMFASSSVVCECVMMLLCCCQASQAHADVLSGYKTSVSWCGTMASFIGSIGPVWRCNRLGRVSKSTARGVSY